MIVFWGGAFDPPHFGHVKPAFELANNAEVAQLRFLPCYQSPHKQASASAEHRLAMLRLVTAPPLVSVDDYEIKRQETSCTVDSLIHFRKQFGVRQALAFALGADAFAEITTWLRYRQLLELAHLIVIARPGHAVSERHCLLETAKGWSELADLAAAPAGHIALFENRQWDVSSSRLRELLTEGQTIRYLLPGVVWNYIRRHKLYGYGQNAG